MLVSSAKIIGAFKTGIDTINLHCPATGSRAAAPTAALPCARLQPRVHTWPPTTGSKGSHSSTFQPDVSKHFLLEL
jgi:hypothetical protein